MKNIFSLHKITNADYFGFEPNEYSKFKFGDDNIAEKFGTNLAIAFINQLLSKEIITKQIVVISSPYAFIPTATFAMKNYFVYELNKWLAANSLSVVQETKIYRTITYKEDYGELDAEERMRLIGNDHFHIDKEFLDNKTLIFLDDIKITGSHERMILKMVNEFNLPNEIFLLYFAELVNNDIHPNIENFLNYHFIKTIFDLDSIIKSERFIINTRIVKFILSAEAVLFRIFIQNHSSNFNNLLLNMALGNSYHTIDAYKGNIYELKAHINIYDKNAINQ
jgi:hypothetical protein